MQNHRHTSYIFKQSKVFLKLSQYHFNYWRDECCLWKVLRPAWNDERGCHRCLESCKRTRYPIEEAVAERIYENWMVIQFQSFFPISWNMKMAFAQQGHRTTAATTHAALRPFLSVKNALDQWHPLAPFIWRLPQCSASCWSQATFMLIFARTSSRSQCLAAILLQRLFF